MCSDPGQLAGELLGPFLAGRSAGLVAYGRSGTGKTRSIYHIARKVGWLAPVVFCLRRQTLTFVSLSARYSST